MADVTTTELDAAARRGTQLEDATLARFVLFDKATRSITVHLKSGASFTFPVDQVEGLSGASDVDLADVEITSDGYGLHWEKLDVDFTIAGLAAGIFGTARYMARKAGRATSDAKAAAARANGAAGGRPRRKAV